MAASPYERRIGVALAIAGLLFIATMTLGPGGPDAEKAPGHCLVCGMFGMVDVILNVALFVPLGAGLRLSGLRWWRALLLAVAVTGTVEFLQWSVIPRRDPSWGDIMTNSIGAAVGVLLASGWRVWLVPRPRAARWLAAAAAGAWLVGTAGTTWALGLSVPTTRLYVQCPSTLGQFAPFTGTVVRASFDGVACPTRMWRQGVYGRPVPGTPAVIAEATVIPGPAPTRSSAIVSVYTRKRDEVAILGRDADMLYFRARMRTHRGFMRTPSVGMRDVFPLAGTTDTIVVRGLTDGHTYSVEAERGGVVRRSSVTLGPDLGWTLLLFWDEHLSPRSGGLSALWTAGLMLPLAFWAACGVLGRSHRPALLWSAGLAILGLGVLPLLGDAPISAAGGWIGAAAGIAIGHALGAWRLAAARRGAGGGPFRDTP